MSNLLEYSPFSTFRILRNKLLPDPYFYQKHLVSSLLSQHTTTPQTILWQETALLSSPQETLTSLYSFTQTASIIKSLIRANDKPIFTVPFFKEGTILRTRIKEIQEITQKIQIQEQNMSVVEMRQLARDIGLMIGIHGRKKRNKNIIKKQQDQICSKKQEMRRRDIEKKRVTQCTKTKDSIEIIKIN